jgi:thioredoxin
MLRNNTLALQGFWIVAALMFAISCSNREATAGTKILSAKAFSEEMKSNPGILIDVRTPEETASGMIEGAKSIDFNSPDFAQNIAQLDKSKTIYVYCKSGGRSGDAVNQLGKLGYQAVGLEGGIMAWSAAGFVLSNASQNAPGEGMSVAQFMEQVKSDKIVLVDFNAVWCKPCKLMWPEIEKLSETYSGKLQVMTVDVDKNPELSNYFKIQGIPMIQFYKAGNKVDESMGLLKFDQLEAILKKHL